MGWSSWVLEGQEGQGEAQNHFEVRLGTLRGKLNVAPSGEVCAGSGSGRQEFMNPKASSSVSLRSLECGDIMGQLCQVTHRRNFLLFGGSCLQKSLHTSLRGLEMFSGSSGGFIWRAPSAPTLRHFPEVSLGVLDLLPSIACDFQPGFFEGSGSRGKTNLPAFSSIAIEDMLKCGILFYKYQLFMTLKDVSSYFWALLVQGNLCFLVDSVEFNCFCPGK